MPRSPEFLDGATSVGLVQRPAQGPVPVPLGRADLGTASVRCEVRVRISACARLHAEAAVSRCRKGATVSADAVEGGGVHHERSRGDEVAANEVGHASDHLFASGAGSEIARIRGRCNRHRIAAEACARSGARRAGSPRGTSRARGTASAGGAGGTSRARGTAPAGGAAGAGCPGRGRSPPTRTGGAGRSPGVVAGYPRRGERPSGPRGLAAVVPEDLVWSLTGQKQSSQRQADHNATANEGFKRNHYSRIVLCLHFFCTRSEPYRALEHVSPIRVAPISSATSPTAGAVKRSASDHAPSHPATYERTKGVSERKGPQEPHPPL